MPAILHIASRRSLPQTLADAKERGWQVLGAAAEPGAQPASGFVLQRPAILVMGNEGYGLRGAVRRLCDAMLQVGAGDLPLFHCLLERGNVVCGRWDGAWNGWQQAQAACGVLCLLPSLPHPESPLPLASSWLQIEDSPGRHTLVDSLNVSVATGILLHRLLTAQSGSSAAAAAAPAAGGGAAAAAAAVAEAAAAGAPEL